MNRQAMKLAMFKEVQNEQTNTRHNHWSHHGHWCISTDSNHICSSLLCGWSMRTATLFILIVIHKPDIEAVTKVFYNRRAAEKYAKDLFFRGDFTYNQLQDWLVENRPFTQVHIQEITMEL